VNALITLAAVIASCEVRNLLQLSSLTSKRHIEILAPLVSFGTITHTAQCPAVPNFSLATFTVRPDVVCMIIGGRELGIALLTSVTGE
jgi:hypothetical protein